MSNREITNARQFALRLLGQGCVARGLALLLAVIAGPHFAIAADDQSPKQAGHVVAHVQQREVTISPTASGTLQAWKSVELRGRVAGYLSRVLFREGQDLKEGDLICEIDDRPYKARLDQAMAQLTKDQAVLANGKRLLDRNKALLASNAVSREDVEQQIAVVQQAEASILIAQTLIEQAKLDLHFTRITAPISGRVGFALVTPGNVIRADETLIATLTSQQMAVIFSLSDVEYLRLIRQKRGDALAVEVFIAAEKIAAGRLQAIDNQVDPATGLIRMKAVLENADQSLIAGMHVNVRLLAESKRNALVVPAAAVQPGPDPYVYVVRNDDKIEARPVTLVAGVIADDPTKKGDAEVAIESGLRVGETVVAEQFAPSTEPAPDRPRRERAPKSSPDQRR